MFTTIETKFMKWQYILRQVLHQSVAEELFSKIIRSID